MNGNPIHQPGWVLARLAGARFDRCKSASARYLPFAERTENVSISRKRSQRVLVFFEGCKSTILPKLLFADDNEFLNVAVICAAEAAFSMCPLQGSLNLANFSSRDSK